MATKASEISELIKQQIKNFEHEAKSSDVGTVVSVTDGITRIRGLNDAQYGEMLEFPGDTFGLALNLEQDSVGAVVLGDYTHISEGAEVKTTNRILEVPVGEGLLGRVVDSLGTPLDGKGPIATEQTEPIEKVAPGVISRRHAISSKGRGSSGRSSWSSRIARISKSVTGSTLFQSWLSGLYSKAAPSSVTMSKFTPILKNRMVGSTR